MDNRSEISAERQMESICHDFEQALQNDAEVRAEDYLERIADSSRGKLLIKIARSEIEYRHQRGLTFSIPEYIKRFPQYGDLIRENLAGYVDSDANLDSTVTVRPHVRKKVEPSTATSGQQVGRYELLSHLGSGGFGEVWKARDPLLNRVVAVKLQRADRAMTGVLLGSFLAEGERLAQLDHEGIVRILDAGSLDNTAYLVSEFMPGGTLQDRLHNSRISSEVAVAWLIEVARALHHAHSRGFVHRDIKPSNILFDEDDRPHLADFGIAASEAELLRETPATVGTAYYMSPEQAAGESHLVDPRSDVYCLGLVLYRMLTGRLPFAVSSRGKYLQQILEREPRPLRSVDSSIPQSLEAIGLKCLQRPMNQRYSSALELAEMLEAWLSSLQPTDTDRRRRQLLLIPLFLLVPAAAIPLANRRFQWLDYAEPEEDAASLIADPQVIAWSPYDVKDEYRYDPERDQFQFDAFGHALFSVDSVSEQTVDLQSTLSIRRWKGLGGVFWGLHRDESGAVICYAVMAGRYREELPFRVEICRFILGPLTGGREGVKRESVLWWTKASLPQGDALRLRVVADANRVNKIILNGEPTLDEPFILPGAAASDGGAVGFCGHLGEVSVHAFAVN